MRWYSLRSESPPPPPPPPHPSSLHIRHVSWVREKRRVWRRTRVVVSRGYLRLSAEMVVLISMGVEEKIVLSCVWRLSTRPLTGQTDGQAHTLPVRICDCGESKSIPDILQCAHAWVVCKFKAQKWGCLWIMCLFFASNAKPYSCSSATAAL